MSARKRKDRYINPPESAHLAKCVTGVRGLDEITCGGLPKGRPTLICGGPGCGKTLLGMEFLVHGAVDFQEPGVCISFEETAEELATNVASLGFDVDKLIKKKLMAIDYVFMERSQIHETGDWDLEALFVRLGYAVDAIGAKRVLLDSIEALFATLTDESLLRSELRRLFRWLKDRGLTAVITAERGDGALTRHGLEEYISDCVILLDNRVTESVVTRRMRVVKYRGSTHGANEYPYLIDHAGFSVLPLTSLELNHAASHERVSSGIAALDDMLGGDGYYRGSTILISGTAGTGKTTIASHFVEAACSRGERCVFFSFEESALQVSRNMQSIGVNLNRWLEKDLLQFSANRPTTLSLEMHLVKMHAIVEEFKPAIVVIDPITALLQAGNQAETRSMLLRLVDFFKVKGITVAMSSLTADSDSIEHTSVAISSLVDVWLLLRDIESEGERNRGIYVLKARGLAHSNQIREFMMTPHGVQLREVYLGSGGIRTGSARVAQEAQDSLQALQAGQEAEKQRLMRERRRRAIEAQIAALQLDLETEDLQSEQVVSQGELSIKQLARGRAAMAVSRELNMTAAPSGNGGGKARGGRK